MNGDSSANLRRNVYRLLTTVTVAMVCARILAVERVYEPSIHRPEPSADAAAIVALLATNTPLAALTTARNASDSWSRMDANPPTRNWPRSRPTPSPTFSSNDRSRWAMIRALVDTGTFAIGRRIVEPSGKYRDEGIAFEDGWQTVDKVLHPETRLFYSTKPPLLPVLVAGEYWLLQKLFGWTLERQTGRVVCTVLITINALPLAFYLILLARLLERYGRSDWGRMFTFAAACFGTFLTTFSTTFSNHTVAAYTTLFAVYPLLMSSMTASRFAFAGFFAGLTACFELPAAAFVAVLGAGLLIRNPRAALLAFAPAAIVPIVAQLALNHAQIGDWRPIYEKTDSVWYRYEGSHWLQTDAKPRGIDFAGQQETRPTYAFHLMFGHHGVFSLTPIWLLTIAGLIRTFLRRREMSREWTDLAILTAIVSVIVIVFFTAITSTVNYGGWTCGPRWFFWLTPLWLLALLPAADRLAESSVARGFGLLLLAGSAFSAWYPGLNPWRHPWIYQALEAWGWKGY